MLHVPILVPEPIALPSMLEQVPLFNGQVSLQLLQQDNTSAGVLGQHIPDLHSPPASNSI